MKKNRDFDQYGFYPGNDTRCGNNYYGMRMKNHTRLSNGTIFNDLERPLTPISRSRHSSMLNTSETVRDTDIVSMEY